MLHYLMPLLQSSPLSNDEIAAILRATQNQNNDTMTIVVQVVVLIYCGVTLPIIAVFSFFVMRRLSAGDKRFASIESDVRVIQTQVSNEVTNNEQFQDRVLNKIDHMDKRVDEVSVSMAETRKDVKHLTEMLTDARPGRGITAKIKQAFREASSEDSARHTPVPFSPDADTELMPLEPVEIDEDDDTDRPVAKQQPKALPLRPMMKKSSKPAFPSMAAAAPPPVPRKKH